MIRREENLLPARRLLPALTATLLSAPALAQAPLPEALDPVTVTATSNPMAAFEYPGQVSVVDRAEIENLNPSTLDDALRYVPGVEFVGGPRRTGEVPSIRGFDGPDVTVLLDGTRQNFNSGHDGRLFIDPDLLRRVEVVRGPTSALYGSGGLGGTIDMTTVGAADFLLPGQTHGARLKSSYRTGNHESFVSGTGFAAAKGFDLIGSLGYRDAGNIDLGNGDTLRNDEQLTSVLLKGSYDAGNGHRLELGWVGYRGDADEPSNGQGIGSAADVHKQIDNDNLHATWRWADPDNALLDLGLTTYYVQTSVDERSLDENDGFPKGTKLDREVRTLGLRADNRSRIDHGNGVSSLLTYGIEGYGDDQDGSNSSTGDGDRPGVPDAKALTGAVFLQNEIVLDQPFGSTGTWLVVPGLRYDHFSNEASGQDDSDDGALSPKLGVTYLPVEEVMVFGSAARAFRAPSYDELYADGVHFQIPGFGDNVFIGNPDLKPQKTWNLELGAGLRLDDLMTQGDRFRVKGSYWWTWGRDFIDLQVDQPAPPACFPPNCDGTTTYTNVHDAKLQGTEVEAAYEHGRVLTQLGYSWVDGEDEETGRSLGIVQPHRLTARLAVAIPECDMVVGIRSIFADSLDRGDDERDAYNVHGVYANWQPTEAGILNGLRIDAGIDNIFDKTYSRVFTDAAEEGRSFMLAASYTFRW